MVETVNGGADHRPTESRDYGRQLIGERSLSGRIDSVDRNPNRMGVGECHDLGSKALDEFLTFHSKI